MKLGVESAKSTLLETNRQSHAIRQRGGETYSLAFHPVFWASHTTTVVDKLPRKEGSGGVLEAASVAKSYSASLTMLWMKKLRMCLSNLHSHRLRRTYTCSWPQ